MVDSAEDELRLTVMRLARRIRLERGSEELRDHHLSVLFTLLREGPMSIGRLGEIERVSAPAMTRTVDAMVSAGHLARTAEPDDARRVVVSMTEAGRRAATEVRIRRAEWFSAALQQLDDEERRTLSNAVRLLQRLADS